MSRMGIISLIFLMGWLTGIVVEDGDLSSVDAGRRLQMARSWHTNEPEVVAQDTVNFGVRGKNGIYHAWYGMGQPIVMFPMEVIGMRLIKVLGIKTAYAEKVQQAFLVYTTFPIVAGLGCVAVFLLLGTLGFTNPQALFGVYGLLYGSTYLNYTQVNQENSLMLLCFATSLWAGVKISQGGSSGYGVVWGTATGFSALMRLTTLVEAVMTLGVILVLGYFRQQSNKVRWKGLWNGAIIFIGFILLERVYHHHRFGDWTSTYFRFFREQRPEQDMHGNFWSGLWGFMFSPNDSVWLFDPLAVLAIGVLIFLFFRERESLFYAQLVIAMCCLIILSVYVIFYSPISFWNGASAWGSRYTTTPMQILSALGAAWFWRFKSDFTPALRAFLVFVLLFAFCEQILSVAFWHNLEEIQAIHHPMDWGVIGERAINVTAKLFGTWDEWGRDAPGVSERLKCWNFTPFLAAKYLPTLQIKVVFAGWIFLIATLIWLNAYIWWRHLLGKGLINE